jgi:hypothetical protein
MDQFLLHVTPAGLVVLGGFAVYHFFCHVTLIEKTANGVRIRFRR